MQASEWSALVAHLGEIETLTGVTRVLAWDEQTYMPPKAAALRGAQQALLARLRHERATDPRIGEWLSLFARDRSPDPVRAACARNLGRTYRRETRVASDLVAQLAHASSAGFQAWLEAKRTARFDRFLPILQTLLDLARRRAESIDASRHPYAVMLDELNPGTDIDGLHTTFARLRDGLVPLLEAIAAAPEQAGLGGTWEVDRQWALSREVATAFGYDFEGGRLDRSEHPFSTSPGIGDVRITTRLEEGDLLRGLGATMHETGHALYEQGLPAAHVGTTVREVASFGLDESQSRFWENFVGRSRAFAVWLAQALARHFPGAPVEAERLYRALNRVQPGAVRGEADEVSYNLHIIIRFEVELALVEGTLAVKDLPEAWNAKYREYLGLTPPDDARGVLQDVHWTSASFGEFPSYTIGNLYAASLGAAIQVELPGLWSQVERGDFAPILGWLRAKIHRHGHLAEAPEIMRAAVGERDHVEDLLTHLWGRHGALYGVTRTLR